MIRVNYPKNILLKPFFILLVIVLAPFALFFSFVRIPFAKNRVAKLNEIIKNDWVSRKRYIYLGYSTSCILADFAKDQIIPNYTEHIIYDEWNNAANKWSENEPDTRRRVTTIWQDIAHDFDGDPLLILFTFPPDDTELSESSRNVHEFWDAQDVTDEKSVYYKGRKLSLSDAQKTIKDILQATSSQWVAQ